MLRLPFRLLPALGVALAGLFPLPARAQSSVEDRLRSLETQLGSLQRENQQLRAELGLEGRAGQTIIKPAGREPTLTVGGLVQMQSDFGDRGDARFSSDNDRFYLRRARINAQGKFLEEFDFRLESEFAAGIAEATGNRAQLTDAYITWNKYPAANVRVGQFKTPFGYEQLAADPRLFTIERSLVNDRLTANRQIGVQVGGTVLDSRVTYATGLFNGTGVNTNANDSDHFMWTGRMGYLAWRGPDGATLNVGANGLTTRDANLPSQPAEFGFDLVPGGTRDNIFAGTRRAGGLDAQLHYGNFDVWAEYLHARFKPLNALPARSFDADGWYVQAAYFAVPKILQAVVKYDRFDPNLLAVNDRTKTWTLGANYYLKADDVKLQADYLITTIDGQPATNHKMILRLQTIF